MNKQDAEKKCCAADSCQSDMDFTSIAQSADHLCERSEFMVCGLQSAAE